MYTSAAGAANYPSYYPTQATGQAQVVTPTAPGAYAQTDNYQARYQQQPMQAAQPKEEYSIINKTDVAFGVAGAVGGFFLAGMVGLTGPIGALILGIALLGLSAGMRAVKHNKEQKQQQQMPQAVHPGFQQQYQYPAQGYQSYSGAPSSYTPGMQQQQSYYSNPQAAPQMPMQQPYAQQPYGQQQPGAAYPRQMSAWDKFLSWL